MLLENSNSQLLPKILPLLRNWKIIYFENKPKSLSRENTPKWRSRVRSSNYSHEREFSHLCAIFFRRFTAMILSGIFLLSYPERSKTHGRLDTAQKLRSTAIHHAFRFLQRIMSRNENSLLSGFTPRFRHVFDTSGKRIIG